MVSVVCRWILSRKTAGAAGANVGADQLSAMPSVHVCWSALVAWAVITASTSRWRWLILAHPIITAFVVVATGNNTIPGEVITGKKQGRRSDDEITLFDSTGIALQDSATVPLEYERAVAAGVGIEKKMIST